MKPANERKAAIQNATLPIVNETTKIVVMISRRYMSMKDYEARTVAPNVPLDLCLKKHDMKNVLYRSRPSVKRIGEDEWDEIVLTVFQAEARKRMKLSGMTWCLREAISNQGNTQRWVMPNCMARARCCFERRTDEHSTY